MTAASDACAIKTGNKLADFLGIVYLHRFTVLFSDLLFLLNYTNNRKYCDSSAIESNNYVNFVYRINS